MKGLSHFCLGLASVTFFPEAIHLAEGGSFILAVAGASGLLPDTLDFKFTRFFLDAGEYVFEPGPDEFDGQKLADTVAAAANKAWEEKREVMVKCHTVQLDSDKWREYYVKFDTKKNEIVGEFGPIIAGFDKIAIPDSVPKNPERIGVAKPTPKIIYSHARPITANIMSGPSFSFKPKKNGVELCFIPWHRQWSHSITLSIVLAILGFVLGGKIWAIALGLPAFIHVFSDITGFMGVNFFPPFTKDRSGGLHLFHADTSLANFFAVWLSALVVIFNVNRFGSHQLFNLHPALYFGYFWVLPFAIVLIVTSLVSRKKRKKAEEETPQGELEEIEEEMEAMS